jgi:hypothetical protein
MRFFGVSLGHADEGTAESWIRSLGLPDTAQARTHRALEPVPHVAVSIALPTGTALELPPIDTRYAAAAMQAGVAHAAGRSGREMSPEPSSRG